MRVFVSFTGKDREIKNQIVSVLREAVDAGDEVWESDEGCTSNYSKESIDAIRQSQVFVVLLSAHSMQTTSYVLNEVVEARQQEMQGKLNLMVFKLDDAPMTEDFAMQLNHISDANHLGRLYRNTEAGIKSLASKVRYLLSRWKKGDPEKPFDVFRPEIEATVLGEPGYFVDHSRDRVFQELDDAFRRSNVVFAVQFNGYGRRSVIRKYAEEHGTDYEAKLYFHQFSGSIFDFFCNGLTISNINENALEGLDDRKTVLRKAELLNKLDTKTLLVVPDVTPGEKDDQFIFDVLKGLRCRLILVVESVPQQLRERFPVVYVNRMEEAHLLELFFYHYARARADEVEPLLEPLRAYFDAIEGHTETVELTARNLKAGRINPEEVPDTLRRISQDSGDALGNKIFRSISGLFRLNRFDDAARKTLLCAALIADIPMDDQAFVKILRKCGVFNGDVLDHLTELRWLEEDPYARTLSIDPLISRVCLAEIPMDEQILEECLVALGNKLTDMAMIFRLTDFWTTMQRFQRVWKVLGMKMCYRATELFLELGNQSLPDCSAEEVRAVRAGVQEECRQLTPRAREACADLWDMYFPCLEILTSDSKQLLLSPEGGALIEGFLSGIQDLGGIEDLDIPPELLTAMRSITQAGTLHQLLSVFFSLARAARRAEDWEEAEDLDAVGLLVEQIGFFLNTVLADDAYTSLKVCEAQLTLIDAFGGYYSETILFRLYYKMSECLIHLAEYTPDLDWSIQKTAETLDKGWSGLYQSREAADLELSKLLEEYLKAMLRAGELEKAEDACCHIMALPLEQPEIFCRCADCLNAVTDAWLEQGETSAALEYLEDALKQIITHGTDGLRDTDEIRKAKDTLASLTETLCILRKPEMVTDFYDRSDTFTSYYDTYAAEPGNRRQMNRYAAMARLAMELDYSSASQEGMQAALRSLSERAGRGGDWGKLAPEVFALFSEAVYRTMGYHLHYVQFIGAAAIFDGNIAEMQNGEGKTCTIALAAVMQTLYGRQAHILDSSAYLCKRNYVWMRGVLEYLGLTAGLLLGEDWRDRLREVCRCDILYSYYNTVAFSVMENEYGERMDCRLRLDAAIVDEADEAMVAKAGTITIQGETTTDDKPLFELAYRVLSLLEPTDSDYFVLQGNSVSLRGELMELVEQEMGKELHELTAAQRDTLERALRTGIQALFAYKRDEDYYVRRGNDGKPILMTESTSDGGFQQLSDEYAFFLWYKENRPELAKRVSLTQKKSLNEWDLVSFFRAYRCLGGSSATASGMKREFRELYGLSVFPIPTNVPVIRTDYAPIVCFSKAAKESAIVDLVAEKHATGQPVLLITGSVPESRRMAGLLRARGIEPALINAENADTDPDRLSYAGEAGAVTVTTALANRGVDICLGGSPLVYARKTLLEAGSPPAEVDRAISGMSSDREAVELRRRYTALCALNWHRISGEKARLEGLGGLCVIGTTCFDDLRVEQQMRGRCGRQGSPGESYVYYSVEDEGLRRLLKERYYQTIKILDVSGEEVQFSVLNRAIEKARLRLQNNLYSGLLETPSVLYYPKARQVILGRIPAIHDEDFDFRKFVLGLFAEDPRYKESFATLRQSGAEALPETSPVRMLAGRLDKKLLSQPSALPSAFADLLCGTVREKTKEVYHEFLWTLLRTACFEAWGEYLERMHAKLKDAELLNRTENARKRYLSDFSGKLARSVYYEHMERVLLKMLFARLAVSRDKPDN